MAVQKYLQQGTAGFDEKAFLDSSSGAGDAGKPIALDASGLLPTSMLPAGVGANTFTRPTSENLSAGDLVDIYDAAGVSTARRADASVTGKTADGFVKAGTTTPANATIYGPGETISGLTSLTIGAVYYLSNTTPGKIVTPAPTTSGHVAQRVGVALSATELLFQPGEAVTRA